MLSSDMCWKTTLVVAIALQLCRPTCCVLIADHVAAEGLTEEEIAAFIANTQHLSIKSFRPSADSYTGLNASFLRPKVASFSQGTPRRGSQPTDISSSDSESEF